MRVSGLVLVAAVLAAAAASGAAVHPLQDAVGLRGAQDDYSASAALANVYAAAAAYCDESAIMDWSCEACQRLSGVRPVKYAYDEKHNVAAYVASLSSESALVSFRGTEPSSLKDWIDDLDYAKMAPYPGCDGCEVHSGFYESYQALRSQILDGLNSLSGLSTVAITGHSLGAAMAALCAKDLAEAGFDIAVVYTFGQPRVGNPAYGEAYAGAVSEYRVVHYKDIVPHLPLEAMGFHHVPTEVWYNEASSSYQVCNGSGEDPSCSDSLTIAASIEDHLHYLNVPISGLC